MRITTVSGKEKDTKADAVFVPFFEDEMPAKSSSYLGTDRIPEPAVKAGFTGKAKQVFSQGASDRMIFMVGLGKKEKYSLEVMRRAYSAAYSKLRGTTLNSIMVLLPDYLKGEAFESVYTLELTLYNFNEFKAEKTEHKIENVFIATVEPDTFIESALKVAEATNFTRDVANLPPSRGTPTLFEERARQIKGLKVTALGRDDFVKLGMGGIEGVSRAAKEPAKMVIMEYGPENEKPLLLVGKGITFDSGGISIKPSANMDAMKFDKCGASAVLGVMKLVADLKLNRHIVGIMPLTENLPGGSAYKPGDILKHYNGKTSEILSTDAEGRLVLADGLAYGVEKYDPYAVIDFATLTGACVVALGNNIAGLMGSDDDLKLKLKEASGKTWERIWELPVDDDFMAQIKSEVADIKNSGGRQGGAETAGAFLRNFVGDKPWAHLDIAGTAWTQEKTVKSGYLPHGATGFGVRLIYEYLTVS